LALRDDAMATIARVPHAEADAAVLASRHPLLAALARGEIGGSYAAFSVVDNESRMHAWRLLPGVRYVVLVGMAERDYLRSWRRMLYAYYAAMSALALLGGAVAWHYRGERRDGRALKASKEQLEASEARFRSMVESLPFPLTITALSDKRLLYVNARASGST
jgi:PAS domain-containing protein